MVFDTETTSLNKPFCYNIGYCVFDTDNNEIVLKKDFVVEQIWHNIPLFSTAYYANKRPLYIKSMRAKKSKMEKFGYITREMYRTIKLYSIESAYAYNSSFDEKVFNFNCDFFKVINPFDNVNIFDIRGMVHNKIAYNPDFQIFCETHNLFTESGNYSTTAETIYKYITNQIDFVEEHTALADSEIETEILKYCINKGCKYNTAYKTYNSIVRNTPKILEVYNKNEKSTALEIICKKITVKKSKDNVKVVFE